MSSVLMAKLGVDASGMDEGLSKGKKKVENAAKDMSQTAAKAAKAGGGAGGGIFGGAIGKLAGFTAGILAFDKIKDFIIGVVDMAGALNDMSENLGVSIERLQKMQGVFGESGIGSEKFGKAMSALASNIEQAKGGNEDAIADFEALGVTLEDLRNMSPDEVLLKISDAVNKMGSSGEKTVKLEAIFGKVGKSMVGAMSQGSDAIKEAGSAMTVMSEDNAKALDQLGDDTARFWNGFKAMSGNALGVFSRSWKHTMGEVGLGKEAETPFATKLQPKPAETEAEKASKAKAEQERLFQQEIAKFQKDREKQAEQTMLEHHARRMDAEDELAKKQEDAERKAMNFRKLQSIEVKNIVHLLDQAKAIGGDIGGEFAAKAGQAKMDLVEAQTQRLLMSPAERVAADREALRLRHAQQKAQRIVERKIREGKAVDVEKAMQPIGPETALMNSSRDLSSAAHALKGLKIVAITNQ
jgi:hypothetical protein